MRTSFNIFLLGGLLAFTSCNKWLDVKPKTQVASADAFRDEQGFKDALTGVYENMTKQDVYGRELSFGFTDVLAQNYTGFVSYNDYYQDAHYNYAYTSTKARIDNIWKTSYNTIANINNLIDNLEKADRHMFPGSDYAVIRGEAYGLRAFNHFDLLRLYAPAPAAGGAGEKGIPYRTSLSTAPVASSTVGEVITKILADLQVASDMLKTADPVVAANNIPATGGGYLRDRHYKFNYYAVRALMARVYLYSGDKAKALACAQEVIESNAYPASAVGKILGGDRIFSSEVIFDLNINTLETLWEQNFSTQLSIGLYLSADQWSQIYELNNGGSADYRYLYQTELQNDYMQTRLCIKLRPATNTNAANRLVLMRASEMYYIAAESLADTEPGTAVDYLNTMRARRNLQPLDRSLSASEIQDEIYKEYQKEFFCEGQLFYYYKRLNKPAIRFSQVVANNAVYVLPKPDDEIEFGN
ncbi:MAG TPA: RagB/SusD family nutrient uptake outer membrane protein [Chitinophaga sp.]